MNELVDLPVERRGHLGVLELHGEAADPLEGSPGGEEEHREDPHPHRHQEEHAVARAQHVCPVLPGRATGFTRRPAATSQDLRNERIFEPQPTYLSKC